MSDRTYLALSDTRAPEGLRPRWIIDELRRQEIIAAMQRFEGAGLPIPEAWGEELREVEGRLEPRP